MFDKREEQFSKNRQRVLIVLAALLILLLFQLNRIAPQFFSGLVTIAGTTIIIVITYRFIWSKTGIRCSHCDGLMEDTGYKVLFAGAKNASGGASFDPLAIKIWRCTKCPDIEYWKYADHTNVGGSTSDAQDMIFAHSRLLSQVELGIYIPDVDAITEEQFEDIVKQLKQTIKEHNRKAGFEVQERYNKKSQAYEYTATAGLDRKLENEQKYAKHKKRNFLILAAVFVVIVLLVGGFRDPIIMAVFPAETVQATVHSVERVAERGVRVNLKYEDGSMGEGFFLKEDMGVIGSSELKGRLVEVNVWFDGLVARPLKVIR